MRVFVSYRRDDNPFVVGRLREHLANAFGAENVFMDVESMAPGVHLSSAIHAQLDRSDVVLVIVGKGWAPERLGSTDDWIALEIRAALTRNKRVVPVLLGDLPALTAATLPEDLAGLAELNAARLRADPDFTGDVQRLIRALGGENQKKRSPRSTLLLSGIGGALLLVVGVAVIAPKLGGTGHTATSSVAPKTTPATAALATSTTGQPTSTAAAGQTAVTSVTKASTAAGTTSAAASNASSATPASTSEVKPTASFTCPNRTEATAVAPDLSMIASACADGTVRVWDPKTGDVQLSLSADGLDLYDVRWSPDGKWIAAAADKGSVYWWPSTGGAPTVYHGPDPSRVLKIAWSGDSNELVAQTGNGDLLLIDRATNLLAKGLSKIRGVAYDIQWSPDGSRFIVGGFDALYVYTAPFTAAPVSIAISGSTGFTWFDDGQRVAAGGSDGRVRISEVTTAKTIRTLPAADSAVMAVAVSPDQLRIAVVTSFQVTVHTVSGDQPPFELKTLGSDAHSVAWSDDGTRLAAGHSSGLTVWRIDQPGARLMESARESLAYVDKLRWIGARTVLAAGSHADSVYVVP